MGHWARQISEATDNSLELNLFIKFTSSSTKCILKAWGVTKFVNVLPFLTVITYSNTSFLIVNNEKNPKSETVA